MNKKYILISLFILIFIWFISYFLYPIIFNYLKIERQIEEVKNITWSVFTWDTVQIFSWDNNSWSIENINQTDYQKFQTYISQGNTRKYNPSNQPTTTSNDYPERSAILNEYLTNNNFYFRLNNKVNTGYLYLNLKNPTKSDVFLYRHNSSDRYWYKISGKLMKSQNLMETSWDEYLFNLKSIPIISYYNKQLKYYNWQTDLNKNQLQFIWWYVVSFDGNKIEEIVIAWE
jgi:hypothetical protein